MAGVWYNRLGVRACVACLDDGLEELRHGCTPILVDVARDGMHPGFAAVADFDLGSAGTGVRLQGVGAQNPVNPRDQM